MQVCALGQPHRNWAEWALVSPCFTHAHPLQRGNKVCGVSGSKRLLINNTTDAGTWITFKLFWYATHYTYLCCCWCCCCLIYRFYHNIIGNHTNVRCVPWVTCLLGCVTECDMSRVSQCHEYLESGWQQLAMTRDHWPHPLPLQPPTALQCCIQVLHSDHVRKVPLDRE